MSKIPKSLKDHGFTSTAQRGPVRMVASIVGHEKQGKTHLALSAPGPIAFFNFDVGTEGVLHKFGDRDILVYDVERFKDADAAKASWRGFFDAYRAAMASPEVRTVVVDTATEAWEMLRLARFGKLTQVMPYQYGPVNAEFRELIRQAFATDKNLLLLHKMKPKYVNDKRTNKYERAGFADIGFLVQVNIEMSYDMEAEEFSLYIENCRFNPTLGGEWLEGVMCDFKMLGLQIMEGTTPEDWGY